MVSVPFFDRNHRVAGTFREFVHMLFSAPRTERNCSEFLSACRKLLLPLGAEAIQASALPDESLENEGFRIGGPITWTNRFDGTVHVSTRDDRLVEIRLVAWAYRMFGLSPKRGVEHLLDDIDRVVYECYASRLPPFCRVAEGGEVSSITDGQVDCCVGRWLMPRKPGMVTVTLGDRSFWDKKLSP
jgi:hypothetical protein